MPTGNFNIRRRSCGSELDLRICSHKHGQSPGLAGSSNSVGPRTTHRPAPKHLGERRSWGPVQRTTTSQPAVEHDISLQFGKSVCAVRGFVRTHFLPFTRSDRESRTTLHLSNLWTKPHGFNPYFLQFCTSAHMLECVSRSEIHLLACFCQVSPSSYVFLKFCSGEWIRQTGWALGACSVNARDLPVAAAVSTSSLLH